MDYFVAIHTAMTYSLDMNETLNQTKNETMKTLKEYFGRDSAYWGDCGDWLVCATLNRDSDCLSRSNYRSFIKILGGKGTEGNKGSCEINENLRIEESTHWACGWLQYLIINPAAVELIAVAEETLSRIDDYPVLDESDFSELEMDEANEVWSNCFNTNDRIKYIREHRREFEFQGLADLIGCARGKFFCGDYGALLN